MVKSFCFPAKVAELIAVWLLLKVFKAPPPGAEKLKLKSLNETWKMKF